MNSFTYMFAEKRLELKIILEVAIFSAYFEPIEYNASNANSLVKIQESALDERCQTK
jgi:hypothetical protein